MKAGIAAAMALLAGTIDVAAQDYRFCLSINRVVAEASLRSFTDDQIRNGLCMTSKEIALAIASRDTAKERFCTDAAQAMMREFRARFPREEASSVIGRC